MFAARIAGVLLAALLLAACAPPAAPAAAPPAPAATPTAPNEPTPAAPPDQPASPASAAPSAPAPVPDVLAEPAPGALQRVSFRSGDRISRPGLYFLNTATGSGEGWPLPDPPGYWGILISDDNRLATAQNGRVGYVVDRQGGSIWRFDAAHFFPLLSDRLGFLFAELQAGGGTTGRFIWTGSDFRRRQTLALAGWGYSPVLSADGRHLALALHDQSDGKQQLVLADLETGAVQHLATPDAPYLGALTLRRWGEGFQAEVSVSDSEPGGFPPHWRLAVRRFSWQGEALDDRQIPGSFVFFSPDGRWVAWEAWPAGAFGPSTVVADARTLRPRLQALGTTPCFQVMGSGGTRWLSDSSALVVDTGAGYRLLTLDGRLQTLPAPGGPAWKEEPQPAPDRPDRFAIGRRAVVSGDGAAQYGVRLEGFVTPAGLSPWGAGSSELRFALPPPGKGGACGERPPVPVRVQQPVQPLPDFPLAVQGSACLPLRAVPRLRGASLSCLPAGTRLAATPERPGAPVLDWGDQSWWLAVRTPQGQQGWVSLAGDPLDWAPAVGSPVTPG